MNFELESLPYLQLPTRCSLSGETLGTAFRRAAAAGEADVTTGFVALTL